MVVSRRGFMRQGSLLVLAAGICSGSASRIFGRNAELENAGATPTELSLQEPGSTTFNYSKATFLPHVQTVFRIYVSSSKILTTTLVSITDIGPVPDTPVAGRESFTLKFSGTESLKQNTYRVEHQTLGSFELFLVPAGTKQKNVYCLAVINRLNQ